MIAFPWRRSICSAAFRLPSDITRPSCRLRETQAISPTPLGKADGLIMDTQARNEQGNTLIGAVLARVKHDISSLLTGVLGRSRPERSGNILGSTLVRADERSRRGCRGASIRGFVPLKRPTGVDEHGDETRLSALDGKSRSWGFSKPKDTWAAGSMSRCRCALYFPGMLSQPRAK